MNSTMPAKSMVPGGTSITSSTSPPSFSNASSKTLWIPCPKVRSTTTTTVSRFRVRRAKSAIRLAAEKSEGQTR